MQFIWNSYRVRWLRQPTITFILISWQHVFPFSNEFVSMLLSLYFYCVVVISLPFNSCFSFWVVLFHRSKKQLCCHIVAHRQWMFSPSFAHTNPNKCSRMREIYWGCCQNETNRQHNQVENTIHSFNVSVRDNWDNGMRIRIFVVQWKKRTKKEKSKTKKQKSKISCATQGNDSTIRFCHDVK